MKFNKFFWIFVLVVLLGLNNFASGSLHDRLIGAFDMNAPTGNITNAVNDTNIGNLLQVGVVNSQLGLLNLARGYVNISNYFLTNFTTGWTDNSNYSFSCWIKFNATPSAVNNMIRICGSTYDGITNSWSGDIMYHVPTMSFILQSYKRGGVQFLATFNLTTLDINKWYMITGTYNGSSKVGTIYVDGVNGTSTINTNTNSIVSSTKFEISTADPYFSGTRFFVDDVFIWNRTLTPAEVSTLYNSGMGMAYPFFNVFFIFPTPVNNSFIINNHFVIASNITNNLGTGVVITHNLYNSTRNLIATYSTNGTFFSHNVTNLTFGIYYYNATAFNGTHIFNSETRQITIYALIAPNITNPINNSNIGVSNLVINWTNATFTTTGINLSHYRLNLLNNDGSFNRTIISNNSLNLSYLYDLYSQNLSIGNYYIQVCAINSINTTSCSQNLFNLTKNALLNVSAFDALTNISLNNLRVVLTNFNNSEVVSLNNSGNILSFNIVKGFVYNLFFDVSGFAFDSINLSANYSNFQFLNKSLLPSNSVFVSCFNEFNNSRILNNSTFTLTNLDSSSIIINSTINNCAFNYSLLVAGRYELEIDPVGFSARKFQIIISNRSSQVLNAYLLADSLSSAIGIYVRSNLGNVLDGVNVNIYRWVNGSFVSVGNDNTDISGFVQFYLMDAINYRIILSYPFFVTKDFTFTPYFANSPYNFVLSQNLSSDFPNIFNNVTFDYSKSNLSISNSSIYTFYFFTNSVGGALVFSNISCPFFSLQDSNPSGALLSQSVNVSGLSSFNCTFSFRTSLMNSTYSWISFFKVYTPSNSSLIGSLPQISGEVGNRGWMTILAYFIIIFAVIVVARMTSDPRVIGFVILSGIVLFVFVGWIGYLVGGVTATIGFFLMFMGGR